jgi:hypothetical protein
VPITPDNLPDDPAALKGIIAAMTQDALVAQAEITRLKFQLARYRGPSAHGLVPWASTCHGTRLAAFRGYPAQGRARRLGLELNHLNASEH